MQTHTGPEEEGNVMLEAEMEMPLLAKRTLGISSNDQKPGGKEGSSLEHSREDGPADTLFQTSSLQNFDPEYISVVLKPAICDNW